MILVPNFSFSYRTYQQLHLFLSGRLEGASPNQITQIIKPRIEQLHNVSRPYRKPNSMSRKATESGTVMFSDGIKVQVDDVSKEFTITLSTHFDIDEIQAVILLCSFLYNEGLSLNGSSSDKSLLEELITAIMPFYYSEQLFVLHTLIPLFCAQQNSADLTHPIESENLPRIIPDGRAFTEELINEYLRKTSEGIPHNFSRDPRAASRWAKQNCKEQLGHA